MGQRFRDALTAAALKLQVWQLRKDRSLRRVKRVRHAAIRCAQ